MDPFIQIVRGSRLEGHVKYQEGSNCASFGFEIGMDDSCGIAAPYGDKWDSEYPWLSGRRTDVLTAIGEELIKEDFPSHKLRITELFLWVVS
jgi:hypothetical protein